MGTNDCGAVHYLSAMLKALADLQSRHHGINGGKCAENLVHGLAHFEGQVAFGIPGFWSGHASSHPKKDAAVGGGFWVL